MARAAIDLHSHSVFSDGTVSPEVLVSQAADAGLVAYALTDHDSVEGIPRAMEAAHKCGLNLIPGIEISADHGGEGVHILGYFVDWENRNLGDSLHRMQTSRRERIPRIVERLRSLGLDISSEDVFREHAEGSWGRPHVARALLRKGLVDSLEEAFRRYLRNAGPAFVVKEEPTAREAITLIHQAGGVAVLAHPLAYRMTRIQGELGLSHLLDGLIHDGLDGMEVTYANTSQDEIVFLMRHAQRRNLAFSGGSDYHGKTTPDVRLGTGRGGMYVPDSWLNELHNRRRGEGSRPWQGC